MIKPGRFTLSAPSIIAISGMIVVSIVGWVSFYCLIGAPLERLSYDLPFRFRSYVATPEICLVVMDENSARALNQPVDAPWDRRLHAQLTDTLAKAGARAVLFDLIFSSPSTDPKVDAAFAQSIAQNGHVFLGADLSTAGQDVAEDQLFAPVPVLRKTAAGWGLLAFRPVDPDSGVRQIYTGNDVAQSVTWIMARALGAKIPETPDPSKTFWINYYKPAGLIPSVGYDQALNLQGLPVDYFKNKIVIVGGKQTVVSLDEQKDLWFTPYTRWGYPFSAGMEIHATILLNLLHQQWLERLSPRTEGWIVVLYGCAIVALLAFVSSFCPFRATGVALLAMLLVGFAALLLFRFDHVWFNWLVPAVIQTPLALFWGVGMNYLVETRRRMAITHAFSLYLSPEMAKEIAAARFDLKPGGKLVEATIMFTDLKGFTKLSEEINDPLQISGVMISYFNNTTKHILDNRGMISKYMGDAVYAIWGAPLADDDHAYHAVVAAWGMHQYSQLNVHGHHLLTRIGVNTGMVVAGNLGSEFRFDYTCIGDPVNLASRLEGLNKYLGTQVLLTDATLQRLKGRFVARCLGRFVLLGKKEPVIIHELLGPTVTNVIKTQSEMFGEALGAFQAGDLAKARKRFEETLAKCDQNDGPCEFYIREIDRLKATGLPKDWTGAIVLDSK